MLYVWSVELQQMNYVHKDYQGSVEAVTYGNYISDKQSFGVFGARESTSWQYDLIQYFWTPR
ncbi:hypothetical protein [Catenovulum sediminis]|uniref:hypothetical protein n=1 Tax=Catenovulum sediminis TaxID=1740262 RepID=UPI00117F6020|nr:hypothetical protein [Catenovulum sediminis]